MEVLVFVPTWNESSNISPLIHEIFAQAPEVDVLVIDDQSPDGTSTIVNDLKTQYPQLHLLEREGERGRGWAGIAGYIWSLNNKAKYVIEMDADFSHQPQYIPSIIEALKHNDVVIASRYMPGGKDLRPGLMRRTISRMANLYQQVLFKTHVKDCTSGYRGYRAEVLESIGVRDLNTWGPAILSDVLYRVIRKKFSIKEIPIEFPDRERGKSTFSVKIMIEGLLNVLKLRFGRHV